MPLTYDFKETIRARAQGDAKFRRALLREAVEAYLGGDLETGKAVLRDYVNATVGFRALEEKTEIPAKSLMRMFSAAGNPNARNLFGVLGELQRQSGIHLHARSERAEAR